MQDITGRVARGAALLDRHLPGWVDRIDLETLDVESPCRCILGQTWDGVGSDDDVFGPYEMHGLRLFGPEDFENEVDTLYGFNAEDREYAELTAEWKRVILARRGEALRRSFKAARDAAQTVGAR